MARRRARSRDGFTVIEVLIALVVLGAGIAGILSIQMTALRATAYSRHAAEAAVLAEDRLELLRAIPSDQLASGSDQVDELGSPRPDGQYLREWTVESKAGVITIAVTVTWDERGEPRTIEMVTQRSARQ